MNKIILAIIRFLGGHYEWETQTTDHQGCFRTWTNGFGSLEEAMEDMRKDIGMRRRWNQYMPDHAVKWRVERRIVWTRYYYDN